LLPENAIILKTTLYKVSSSIFSILERVLGRIFLIRTYITFPPSDTIFLPKIRLYSFNSLSNSGKSIISASTGILLCIS